MFPVELTSEEVSEYYEQFSDASESSIAADALMYLGRIIWSNRNLRGKSAKEWCLQQLTAAPDLHGTLMQAHAARDFESLSESSETLIPINLTVLPNVAIYNEQNHSRLSANFGCPH